MTDIFDKYNKFLADTDRDDRVGDHDAVVTGKTEGVWEKSGDRYTRIAVALASANNATVDFNLNELPTDEEMAAVGTWDTAKKKAVASGIQLLKALDKFYGKTAATLDVGDEIRIKAVKNKAGYIRVVAILDPNAPKAPASAARSAGADIPF